MASKTSLGKYIYQVLFRFPPPNVLDFILFLLMFSPRQRKTKHTFFKDLGIDIGAPLAIILNKLVFFTSIVDTVSCTVEVDTVVVLDACVPLIDLS